MRDKDPVYGARSQQYEKTEKKTDIFLQNELTLAENNYLPIFKDRAQFFSIFG